MKQPELIRGAINLRPRHRGSVVTIGAFDGVHRGHQAILDQVLAAAAELALPAVVIVFEPLPREHFEPECTVPRLQPLREKFQALVAHGIHRVLCLRFNEALSRIAPQAFVQRYLVDGLGVKTLIIGDDFRFGHQRRGDDELLAREAARHGFRIESAATVEIDGERVSSTRIRRCLAAGDFDAAEKLLGRPFAIEGRVQYGRQLGRQLAIPTVNIPLRRRCSPVQGVFAVQTHLPDGRMVPGAASVGVNPTIAEGLKPVLEVHLFDFNGDLYGARVNVEFKRKLREEQKFESVAAMQQQIQRDIADAKAFFANADNAHTDQ